MKVGAAIYSMLKDDSAVAALVGTRIYPELAEEGAVTPYVVYSVVSNTPVDTKESAPVDEAQLEVFSVADTYAAANDLADKVRTALSRQSKKVLDTVTVQSIKYTNEVTEVSAERNMYISVQDYTARLTPVPLLLDVYSGAHAVYSLRRLRSNYTGPAVRLRRSNDSETLDIGFDSDGNLDIAACNALFNGSNLTVKKWYDQSGNGNDVTQSTNSAQPLLYNTSGLISLNGRPVLQFLGNDGLPFDESGLDVGSLSAFSVFKYDNTAGTQRAITLSGYENDRRFYIGHMDGGNFAYTYGNASVGSATGNTNVNLHTMIAGATIGHAEGFVNGVSVGNTSLVTGQAGNDTGIGRLGGSDPMEGFVSELIVYGSDQSVNRTVIENNINAYYSIY